MTTARADLQYASHTASSRLCLLSARPIFTFPASALHRPWPVPIYNA